MKYIINVEPKIKANINKDEEYCHIVSLKDSTITRIITEKGTEIKDINDYVKKGDIIISGDIKLNEETKKTICAKGKVYGKTWYTINVSIPKTYANKIIKNKKRYNLEFKYNNKKYLLFRPRLSKYITNNKKILSIFNLDIYLNKDFEIAEEIKQYTEEELSNKLNELIKDKMSNILKGDYTIKEQKVLKKQDNNSTIDIEIFIVAEELISTSKSIDINNNIEQEE